MGWRVSQKIPTVREVTMNIYINVLQSNHNIQLSKALSFILRHGAAKEGLQMTQGNYRKKKTNLL